MIVSKYVSRKRIDFLCSTLKNMGYTTNSLSGNITPDGEDTVLGIVGHFPLDHPPRYFVITRFSPEPGYSRKQREVERIIRDML